MDRRAIEGKARGVLVEVWRRFEPDCQTRDAIFRLLEPDLAAEVLGFKVKREESLGVFGSPEGRFEVAGAVDLKTYVISVSTHFPATTIRFTLAHEVGHVVLHPDQLGRLHRDRPIAGLVNSTISKPSIEVDADYFAACLLVPRKLLRREFLARFYESPFQLDEHSRNLLTGQHTPATSMGPFDLATYLATSEFCAGQHFDSLSRLFSVSPLTLARRLLECNLIVRN